MLNSLLFVHASIDRILVINASVSKSKYNINSMICISSRFFENQPDEICSHLSKKASKGRFLDCREAPKITVTKEKGRRKRKSEEEERRKREKSNGYTLRICNSYFGGKKNCWTQKVHLAITFLKNPARFILQYFIYICCIVTTPYNAKSWLQSGVILIQEGT